MAKLEGSIKRYIGLSTDTKPGSAGEEVIEPGSSFFETDTWRIARFSGAAWQYEAPDTALVARIDELVQAQRDTNEVLAAILEKL